MESPIRHVIVETLGNDDHPVRDDPQSQGRRTGASQRHSDAAAEVDMDWFKLFW